METWRINNPPRAQRIGRHASGNGSYHERLFAQTWEELGGPELTPEHPFHARRKWRFDFAHLPTKTAIELEGGIWSGGRHTRGNGFKADCEKYNEAQFAGWTIYRFTSVNRLQLQRLVRHVLAHGHCATRGKATSVAATFKTT